VLATWRRPRFANGRKNHIEIEINGAKARCSSILEDMNRLKFYNGDDLKDRRGFRDILVTEGTGGQPYVNHWWPPGHVIGYEHTFVHTVADFVNACMEGKPVSPTFEDGLKTSACSPPSRSPPKGPVGEGVIPISRDDRYCLKSIGGASYTSPLLIECF